MVPGIGDSGPEHWQSWIEEITGIFQRIHVSDWDDPSLPSWTEAIDRQVIQSTRRSLIVAHSFGCLAAAEYALMQPERVAGLLLVAPADPAMFKLGDAPSMKRLPVPLLLIASRNDPWMPLHVAHRWGEIWGADFIDAGEVGHLNVKSGFGPWPDGIRHLECLRAKAQVSAP